jgi:hypothetical protein
VSVRGNLSDGTALALSLSGSITRFGGLAGDSADIPLQCPW